MAEGDGKITHVSDTALMIAACRAYENGLEDAFVHDPFAARLAGERGAAMLGALQHANVLRLGIAIRTRFVNELLLDALATHPITTVLSVGCGLATLGGSSFRLSCAGSRSTSPTCSVTKIDSCRVRKHAAGASASRWI